MGFSRGKDAVVTMSMAGGGIADITRLCDSAEWTFDKDSLDTTTFGAAWKSSIGGFSAWTGTLGGKLDAAQGTYAGTVYGTAAGPGTVIPGKLFYDWNIAAATAFSTLRIYPVGSASGNEYFEGAVMFSGYQESSPVDGVATWKVKFDLAQGSVTRGTAP